jgi:hypothetical protein
MTDPFSPCARCTTHDYHQDSAYSVSPGETCQLHNQTFCELHVGWAPTRDRLHENSAPSSSAGR